VSNEAEPSERALDTLKEVRQSKLAITHPWVAFKSENGGVSYTVSYTGGPLGRNIRLEE
jgi:hypothetical protein